MQRTQFCSCYISGPYWICALYYMSITTLARCLSQEWGFSVICSVFIQQKRTTINKNVLFFQNEMSLQKLLQYSLCQDVNNINFQKSPNIWVAAGLHFGVISSPLFSSLPPCMVSGIYSVPSRKGLHCRRQNSSPEIRKMHTLLHDCIQHMYILANISPLSHLLHQKIGH